MISWYSHTGGWGWGWWPGIVWAILLGAAVLAGAIYLGRWGLASAATGPVPPPTGSAEKMLAERYARGDIDAEEYRDRLEVLREHPDG